jgi:hypothetical protein
MRKIKWSQNSEFSKNSGMSVSLISLYVLLADLWRKANKDQDDG